MFSNFFVDTAGRSTFFCLSLYKNSFEQSKLSVCQIGDFKICKNFAFACII